MSKTKADKPCAIPVMYRVEASSTYDSAWATEARAAKRYTYVRTFTRYVRAGGTCAQVTVVVVGKPAGEHVWKELSTNGPKLVCEKCRATKYKETAE